MATGEEWPRRAYADGTKIREIRLTRYGPTGRRWTQTTLAKRAGISKRAVQYIETGRRPQPYPETMKRLADALGVSIDMISNGQPQ